MWVKSNFGALESHVPCTGFMFGLHEEECEEEKPAVDGESVLGLGPGGLQWGHRVLLALAASQDVWVTSGQSPVRGIQHIPPWHPGEFPAL